MNYVPCKEAGILLFNSLKGELEEEMEDAPVDGIYCPTGIDFVLEPSARQWKPGACT